MVEGKLHGVLNGIDMERYDPASDPNLTANYSLRRMAGKAKDKAALQRMMGLAERKDTPVVAMVSRLVSHKGLDLVCETLDYFMEKDMQLVVLGKGDGKYESFFSWAQAKYPGPRGGASRLLREPVPCRSTRARTCSSCRPRASRAA